LDENGNPIAESDAADEAIVEQPDGETAEERSAREAAEAEYARAQRDTTLAYVECLKSEEARFFGSDYGACDPTRADVEAHLAADIAPTVIACLEEDVLGKSRSGIAGCETLEEMTPAVPQSTTVRWP
jgi:hypothetical protein